MIKKKSLPSNEEKKFAIRISFVRSTDVVLINFELITMFVLLTKNIIIIMAERYRYSSDNYSAISSKLSIILTEGVLLVFYIYVFYNHVPLNFES